MFFIPPPSSSAPAVCKHQCLSTEINCSLTHNTKLPVRRKSTIKVSSNPTPLSPPPPILNFFVHHQHSSAPLSLINQLINLFLSYIVSHGAAETGSQLTDFVGPRVGWELSTKRFTAASSDFVLLGDLWSVGWRRGNHSS